MGERPRWARGVEGDRGMKKRVASLLICALVVALTAPAAAGMWYDAAVTAVTGQGLMTGTGAGFDPEGAVTRATVFQTLYNLEGRPSVEDSAAWPDAAGKWYEPAACWAKSAGLTQGTGAGFEGDRAVTRAELVVALSRYAQSKGTDLTQWKDVELLRTYMDAELLARWDVDAFRWAVGTKVIGGQSASDGLYLAPGQGATRAELAQILVRLTALYPASTPADQGADTRPAEGAATQPSSAPADQEPDGAAPAGIPS